MDNNACIKYDMCHIVKSRIRHNNTKRAYCVKEEGYGCAFFLPKIKYGFDTFTNMSCEGCEAGECASACKIWIDEHDAALVRKAREQVLEAVLDGNAKRFCPSIDDTHYHCCDVEACIREIFKNYEESLRAQQQGGVSE
jgi:hypothetical protein